MGFDQVIERMIADPSFADAARRDPADALAAYDLDLADLRRLERFLSDPRRFAQLFTSESSPTPPARGGTRSA